MSAPIPHHRSGLAMAATAATATIVLCSAVLYALYAPLSDWRAFPLAYGGDSLWNLFVAKTVQQTGWYGENPLLGAPFGASFLDFAKPEVLHLALFWLISRVTSNLALIHNAFYFLSFYLVALSALTVLRGAFLLRWPLAIAGALLFAFLPYHFLRLDHLFLANYYAVPAAAWLVVRAHPAPSPGCVPARPDHSHWPTWAACVVVASTSIYYAFFALYLILAMGVLDAWRMANIKPLLNKLKVAALITGLVAINLAPTFLYRANEGTNAEVATRSPEEVEVYALRPVQMLLPPAGHRSSTLAAWTQRHESHMPYVNENRSAALGLLGSIGVVLLLLLLISRHPVLRTLPVVCKSAQASTLALVLAIPGGLGSLIAFTISPQFRALNRISLFIGFFAIAALLVLAQHGSRKFPDRIRQLFLVSAALIALVVGLWDQTPGNARPDLNAISASYAHDRDFVQRVALAVPQGSRILQWPYIGFPEAAPMHQEGAYAQLRGFLHSSDLRWSFAGMRGRLGDRWHRSLSQLPLALQIRHASRSGFKGIWLTRLAFSDNGHKLESDLRALGMQRAFESQDKSLAFYSLPDFAQVPATPLLPLRLAQGFYPWEYDQETSWAWSSGDATLLLDSSEPDRQQMRVCLALGTLVPRTVEALVEGQQVASVQLVPGELKALVFDQGFNGRTVSVELRSNAPSIRPDSIDPRSLAISLHESTSTCPH